MGWLPKSVLDEVEDLKVEKRLVRRSDALNEMVQYARIGRETERIMKFDFSRSPLRNVKKRGGGV